MDPARIAELLAPFLEMPPANDQPAAPNHALYHNISTYVDMLMRWNARTNLTGIRNPEEIVTRHFGESLFAARHLFLGAAASPAAERRTRASLSNQDPTPHRAASERKGALALGNSANDQRPAANERLSLADVGSGAGFPGIPLKLWCPRISLTLIEANHKKSAFLREVCRSLTLTDVNVFNGRAEDLPRAQAGFDLVTVRAVERFEAALKTSADLLAPAGRLALLIGASQLDAARTVVPSLCWSHPLPIPGSYSRVLLVGTSPS